MSYGKDDELFPLENSKKTAALLEVTFDMLLFGELSLDICTSELARLVDPTCADPAPR